MTNTKLEEFRQLVDNHDLTFSYSDDSQMWRRGQAQLDAILSLGKKLSAAGHGEECTKIWAERVDRSLDANYRKGWYRTF